MKANLLRALFLAALPAMLAPTAGRAGDRAPRDVERVSGVHASATRRRAPSASTSNGVPASTSAPTSAATSATPPRKGIGRVHHYDHTIATIVSPKDCGRCHAEGGEGVRQLPPRQGRPHPRVARQRLAEVVEGNRGMITPGSRNGNSAAAVNGCWQCHGSRSRCPRGRQARPGDLAEQRHRPHQPGRLRGRLQRLPQRHEFSAAQARHPDTCGKCHLGPDHPQKEIYEESKHGIAFFANEDKMNLDSPKVDRRRGLLACADLRDLPHVATKNQPVTHDIGMRISGTTGRRSPVRPEVSDAKMGLPGKDVPWQVRRANMKDVC
jgi:hydroxylamine dehydrogenase